MTAPSNLWKIRHAKAMEDPHGPERPIVSLMATLGRLVAAYGEDGFLRKPVGEMLAASLDLLNADLGRLDGGSLDTYIRTIAESIGFDLDTSEFTS
jgi:hypothetical protein